MSVSLKPVLPELIIQPSKGWSPINFRELWEYRELLFFLIVRDVKVRYRQTILGASWAILQPLSSMVIFSIFFGELANMPSDGIPYPIFSYTALVPWSFFANSLQKTVGSLVGSAGMFTKVYFPRLIIPISAAASTIVDFFLAFLVLLGMMVFFGTSLTVNVVWLPVLLLLAFVTALGVGLWLSVLNVQFRDVGYVVPFLIQLWLFATPIVYSSSLLSPRWRVIYGLNPMAGVVEGFRWALLGTDTAPGPLIAVSALASLLILIGGLFYFRRMDRTVADLV